MSYPQDGQPRFVVGSMDANVLDRADCHRVVARFGHNATNPIGEYVWQVTMNQRFAAFFEAERLNREYP